MGVSFPFDKILQMVRTRIGLAVAPGSRARVSTPHPLVRQHFPQHPHRVAAHDLRDVLLRIPAVHQLLGDHG